MSKTFKPQAKSKKQTTRALKRTNGKLTTLDIANSTLYGDAPAPRVDWQSVGKNLQVWDLLAGEYRDVSEGAK